VACLCFALLFLRAEAGESPVMVGEGSWDHSACLQSWLSLSTTVSVLRAGRIPLGFLALCYSSNRHFTNKIFDELHSSPGGHVSSKIAVSNSAITAATLFHFLVCFYVGL
jgi:hypothetical protein